MKQSERILQYMQDFGSITPLEALDDLGVMPAGGQDLRPQKGRASHLPADGHEEEPIRRGSQLRRVQIGGRSWSLLQLICKTRQIGKQLPLHCTGPDIRSESESAKKETKPLYIWSIGGNGLLNHIVIQGRLTRSPELRRTGNGTAVASFTLGL